jgi:hypothetical protein
MQPQITGGSIQPVKYIWPVARPFRRLAGYAAVELWEPALQEALLGARRIQVSVMVPLRHGMLVLPSSKDLRITISHLLCQRSRARCRASCSCEVRDLVGLPAGFRLHLRQKLYDRLVEGPRPCASTCRPGSISGSPGRSGATTSAGCRFAPDDIAQPL